MQLVQEVLHNVLWDNGAKNLYRVGFEGMVSYNYYYRKRLGKGLLPRKQMNMSEQNCHGSYVQIANFFSSSF